MKRFVLAALFATLFACFLVLTPKQVHGPAPPPKPLQTVREPAEARPEYKHAVIRRGAYSAMEVQAAADSDPVVRAHYSDIRIPRLQLVSSSGRPMYASYRQKGKVYWTAKPVAVPKGEAVLTDGVHMVRARCGNRLSETPQLPTAAAPPPLEELDQTVPRPPLEATLSVLGPLDAPPGGYLLVGTSSSGDAMPGGFTPAPGPGGGNGNPMAAFGGPRGGFGPMPGGGSSSSNPPGVEPGFIVMPEPGEAIFEPLPLIVRTPGSEFGSGPTFTPANLLPPTAIVSSGSDPRAPSSNLSRPPSGGSTGETQPGSPETPFQPIPGVPGTPEQEISSTETSRTSIPEELITHTPEPSTFGLIAAGLLLLAGARKRRTRSAPTGRP